MQSHGGVVGAALFQLAHRLVQDVGVGILVVFLLLVGAILVTGASLGGTLRATGSGVAETTRMMRALSERHRATAQRASRTTETLHPKASSSTGSPAARPCSRPTRRGTS